MEKHDSYVQQAIQDLTCCGYQILEVDLPDSSYPAAQLITNKQNGDTFLPDIVCEKEGKHYIVEVKTGFGGITYDDTFEQLKKMSDYTKAHKMGFLIYIDWDVSSSWSLAKGKLSEYGIDNFTIFPTYAEREPNSSFICYIRNNEMKAVSNLKMNVYTETKPDKIFYPNTNCGFTPDMTFTHDGLNYLCVCIGGLSAHTRCEEKLKFFDKYSRQNNLQFLIYTYCGEKAIQAFIKKENLQAQVYLVDYDPEESEYAHAFD